MNDNERKVIKSIQSTFDDKTIKEKLIGYTLLKNDKYSQLKPGDLVRYMSHGKFKMGGVVKQVSFPKYFVCMNMRNRSLTWCVQFNEPTLKLYVKTTDKVKKEKDDARKIMELYKQGKLVKI